ncbi:hypothetical protein Ancab_037710 [Ancistrocladus abbreviatus]
MHTLYPKLCHETLLGYVNSTNLNPHQLAQIALRVSLVRARYARAYLTKVAVRPESVKGMEYQAVRDCVEQINDSVAQLSQSINELSRIIGDGSEDDFLWHSSNVETWTSAALTDQTTCLDGFPGRDGAHSIKTAIKGKVVDVAQATSNALALINSFIARHKFLHGTKRP